MKKNEGFSFVMVLIIIALFVIIGGVIYYFNNRSAGLPSSINNSNNITNISCDSGKIPLLRKGEYVAKKISDDIDMDGIKELIVTYEKEVPGWEGMPMLQDRFALFFCKNNRLVELYNDDQSYSFDLVNYESGKAILINSSGGWYLLIKKGENYEKLYTSDQRLQELKKISIRYLSEDPSRFASVVNNNIVEILKGYKEGDYFTKPSAPEVEITYEYKNGVFNVVSVNRFKKVEINNIFKFRYPGTWSCEYLLYGNWAECYDGVMDSGVSMFRFYPLNNKNIKDAVTIDKIDIDPSNNQCIDWLRNNQYKYKDCIYRNYAIFTDSNSQTVIEGFKLLLNSFNETLEKYN